MQFTSGSSSKIMLTDLSTAHYLLFRIPKDALSNITGQTCLFPVYISPCPVLSAIMSQQLLPIISQNAAGKNLLQCQKQLIIAIIPTYEHNRILCNI